MFSIKSTKISSYQKAMKRVYMPTREKPYLTLASTVKKLSKVNISLNTQGWKDTATLENEDMLESLSLHHLIFIHHTNQNNCYYSTCGQNVFFILSNVYSIGHTPCNNHLFKTEYKWSEKKKVKSDDWNWGECDKEGHRENNERISK